MNETVLISSNRVVNHCPRRMRGAALRGQLLATCKAGEEALKLPWEQA